MEQYQKNLSCSKADGGKVRRDFRVPRADKAPPGFEGTVKAMKKHAEIDNPFALAWYMKNKGDTPRK